MDALKLMVDASTKNGRLIKTHMDLTYDDAQVAQRILIGMKADEVWVFGSRASSLSELKIWSSEIRISHFLKTEHFHF